MKKVVLLILVACLMAGCGSAVTATPTAAPDLVATQVAVMAAAAATLTADAPTPVPTEPPAPTATPIATQTATVSPTPSPLPSATRRPAATATPSLPPVGPTLGRFAVVNVRSDDVLNVRTGPGVGYPIAGTIPYYGSDVDLFAGGRQVGDSWWVPVAYDYGGVSGWANSRYLAPQVGYASEQVAPRAAEAIMALNDRDLVTLSLLVHPVLGVRFSPYATVHPGVDGDLVFSAGEIQGLMTDSTVYSWGLYDGSGLPIDATFQAYYEEFVYDVDFVRPDVVGFDERVGQGNSIDNIATVYPDGVMVEYHFEGFDPQYAGMDWRSLRLVFEELNGAWYLVGIVHDEWTI